MLAFKTKMSLIPALFFAFVDSGTVHAAQPQNLDLGALSAFEYVGQDELSKNSPCHLSASPIGKDFSGRHYQDFRIWVDNRKDLNFNIRRRGPDHVRTPDQVLDSRRSQFNVYLDGVLLEIVADNSDSTVLDEFHFIDLTGVTGTQNVQIRCKKLNRTPS